MTTTLNKGSCHGPCLAPSFGSPGFTYRLLFEEGVPRWLWYPLSVSPTDVLSDAILPVLTVSLLHRPLPSTFFTLTDREALDFGIVAPKSNMP